MYLLLQLPILDNLNICWEPHSRTAFWYINVTLKIFDYPTIVPIFHTAKKDNFSVRNVQACAATSDSMNANALEAPK